MKKKGLIFVILLFLIELAFARQFSLLQQPDTLTVRSWTLEDGLPVNTIGRVTQDSTGYLWISTYDGLVRFDGLNFKVFNFSNTPAMPHNRATLIYIQEGTGMWIGLEYGGVLLLQDGKFKHFGNENGFTNSDLTKVYEDSTGRMFFITHAGLFVYENGTFTRFFESDNPKQNQISAIVEDQDGSLWMATNFGLLNIQNGEITEYFIRDEEHNNQILSLYFNSNGILTAGTSTGMYELQNGKLISPPKYAPTRDYWISDLYIGKEFNIYFSRGRVFEHKNGLVKEIENNRLKLDEIYSHTYLDSDGLLWLIGTSGTLSIYRNGAIEGIQGIEELNNYFFNSVFEDREGTLWFGTSLHGLVSVTKSKVRTIGSPEGLSANNILALFEDSQNRYWVGTRGGGLNVIEDGKITQYGVQEGIASTIVHTVGEDKNGDIWVGYHQEGIDKLTENSIRNFKFGNNIEINDVRSIFSDSEGVLWIGTYRGLISFDPDNYDFRIYTSEDGLSGTKIRYITEDPEGGIWTGSLDGGVSRFYENKFQNFTSEEGLSSNNVRSVYIDEKNPETVWIGTENNGLNRLRDGNINFVNMVDGLPDHIIHWISQDDYGWLWMSSNRGIFKIDKEDLNQYLDGKTGRFTLIQYGAQDGMRNPEGNGSFQEAGLKTSNDHFWFATQEGVAIFDIEQKKINQVAPTVLINGIRAGGEHHEPTHAKIEGGYNSFEVDFHALTFVAPEKTRFRYRLSDYDEDWHEISGERTATYINVPAGIYTFEVLAANNDGIWSEKPARATITIPRVFYEQPWFYLLLILFLGVGYYGVSQIRYRYLLNQQKKLEEIIEAQTAQLRKEKNEIQEISEIIKKQAKELEESNKTKDKFFSLIAHDLRNPFQALIGLTELTLMDAKEQDNPDLKDHLTHIYSSAKSLHTFVEELLSWASLQNGKMKPSPEPVNLKELGERIIELFKNSAEQKEITLKFNYTDEFSLSADLNMMETVLRNLISNSLKFTESGGDVSVSLYQDGEHYIMEVKDNGIGMPAEMVNTLLRIDTNSSRSGTNNEKGTGLGLLISKEMIALHNGELKVKSAENKGTKFTVILPAEGLPEASEND